MAAALVAHHCDARQARQLYAAWRQGSRTVRARILAEPELFWKTQRQPPQATPASVEQLERDLEMALAILRSGGRRLPAALAEMHDTQQEQTHLSAVKIISSSAIMSCRVAGCDPGVSSRSGSSIGSEGSHEKSI